MKDRKNKWFCGIDYFSHNLIPSKETNDFATAFLQKIKTGKIQQLISRIAVALVKRRKKIEILSGS
jgi:hypothetical protein